MTPEALMRTVEDFLAGARDAVVLDEGAVLFDLAQAKYSVSGERNKCLIHLWSEERNLVRRVLDVEAKREVLQLAVQRLGQTHPSKLEICRQRDRRTPTAKRATRLAYQQSLQGTLERRFSTYEASRLTTCVDLEHSFGPIYARGLLRRGQSGFAGGERAGDAILDRCRVDVWHSLAGCLPKGASGKNGGRRPETVFTGGDVRIESRASGPLAPGRSQMAVVRIGESGGCANGDRRFRPRQCADTAGALER